MKKATKILSIILAILMVIFIIPITASATTYSGACGENVIWIYDDTTCTLTISGTGDMYDYKSTNRPWEIYKNKIKSVVVNDDITKIGAYAFYRTGKVESITLPVSISELGEKAFYGCESLTSIVLPDKITLIDDWTFAYCENLTSITIPNKVTTIGDYAFSDCYNLVTVTISDSVTTIGDSAFASCESLESVIIPKGASSIAENAFSNCYSITSITVDKDNQHYSNDEHGVLFNKDKTTLVRYPIGNNKAKYTIPDSVTVIGNSAFSSCSNLTNITMPDSVKKIEEEAFISCSNLTDFKISNSVTTIGEWAFAYCDSLTSIEIPDSVAAFDVSVFRNCHNLTTVIIGKGMTTIPATTFMYCYNLTTIVISNSIMSIGSAAFDECYNLKDVYYMGTEESWKALSIGGSNDPLRMAKVHYNYHIHKYNSVVTEPTCTEKGYTAYTCECGHSYVDDYVDALGHNYKNGVCDICGVFTGFKDNHIYKDGVMQKAYQLVEVDGDIYYIGDRHEIIKGRKAYVKEDRINGVTCTDGTPITAGWYEFDENGKMVILNGVVDNHVYKNNTMLKAYQLVEVDGDIYYIGDRHEIIKGRKAYVKEDRINGVTCTDGTPITAGWYEFDENGKMVILNGVVDNHVYKNNTMLKAYQLVEVDGDIYYIGDRHEIIKGRKAYVKEDRINGVTFADGTPISAGYYEFDSDGKLIIE